VFSDGTIFVFTPQHRLRLREVRLQDGRTLQVRRLGRA
jgi:hypothetical protein